VLWQLSVRESDAQDWLKQAKQQQTRRIDTPTFSRKQKEKAARQALVGGIANEKPKAEKKLNQIDVKMGEQH